MCISLRYFFSSQTFQAIERQDLEETGEDPAMTEGWNSEDSDDSLEPFTSDDNPTPTPGTDNTRRSTTKRPSSDSKGSTAPVTVNVSRRSSLRRPTLDLRGNPVVNRSPSGSFASTSTTTSAENSRKNVKKKLSLDVEENSNDNPSPSAPMPTDEPVPEVGSSRRSSMKKPSVSSVNSKGKRVSFHEDVNVRVYPSDESIHPTPNIPAPPIEDIDHLTEEVANRLSPFKAKDAPMPSLEDLCKSISIAEDIVRRDVDNSRPTTSKSRGPTKMPVDPIEFEEEFAEMDLFMRRNYPKYYNFVKSHIITAATDSEEFGVQEVEFKEAIVGCRQYPTEYFQDLENTLTYYERMAGGFDNE